MNAISKRCIVCLCDLHIHTSYEGLVGSRQLPNSPRAWVSEIPQAPGPLHKDTTNVKGRRPGNYNQTSQTFCWNNSTILAHSSSHAVSKKNPSFSDFESDKPRRQLYRCKSLFTCANTKGLQTDQSQTIQTDYGAERVMHVMTPHALPLSDNP